MFRWILILFLGWMVLCLDAPLFSQEETEELEWIWGEVISLDTKNNQIKVKYLDYETDEEKEIVLEVLPETKFENVSSISEIKIGDSASIDYIVKESKNIAKNISIEREIPIEELSLPEP